MELAAGAAKLTSIRNGLFAGQGVVEPRPLPGWPKAWKLRVGSCHRRFFCFAGFCVGDNTGSNPAPRSSPVYACGSPRLPARGKLRTYLTMDQISSSVRIPRDAGIPEGHKPFLMTQWSCPSV